jgi:membrane-associated phospholipid phosphatase
MLLAAPAQADERDTVRELRWDARTDGAVTATATLWFIAAELMKPHLVPEKCRWCYRTPTGDDALNPVDSAIRKNLIWTDPKAAGALSSLLAYVVMPAGAFGTLFGAAANDGAAVKVPVDALLTAEATMLAVNLNEAVKLAFARERPFVHYLPRAPGEVRALTDSPSDDNLSFYSGHTNVAFALASSSGTVALMRGYRLAPLVLGLGIASAMAVGYLRIAADKHYFSDVMVGAIVGTLVGAGVPLLFHPAEERAAPSPAPAPTPLTVQGVW